MATAAGIVLAVNFSAFESEILNDLGIAKAGAYDVSDLAKVYPFMRHAEVYITTEFY